jgi:hypothetical protein
MRIRHAAVLGLLLAMLAGCTKFDIKVAHDPAVDPSRFRTWAWLPPALMMPADQWLPDQYYDRRVRAEIEQILGDKRYAEVAADQADLFVNYRLITDDRTGMERPYAYSDGYVWVRPYRVTDVSYQRGTFIIDVLDAHTKTLIWRGTASAGLIPTASLETHTKRLKEVVSQILGRFPARGH